MKSLAELQAIRDRAKMAVNVRENSEAKTRVLVGMATCGPLMSDGVPFA